MTIRLPDVEADRCLEVSVDVAQVPRVRQIGRAIRAIALVFALGGGDTPPVVKVPCRVVVKRRDNGREVVGFDYYNNVDALAHAASLRERLTMVALAEFCLDLGIDNSLVSGVVPVDGQ